MSHRNKKSLGQHFLKNPQICHDIVDLAGDISNKTVIEIGTGNGALTNIIAERAKKFIAIEKDSDLKDYLENLSQGHSNFSYILGDALKIDLRELVDNDFIIISNLPYNVGTKLFINWLQYGSRVIKMILMFQREVALRINAREGDSNYGRLSIISYLLANIKYEFPVNKDNFMPQPKVDSAVISVKNLNKPRFDTNLKKLEEIINIAFNQRRKMIHKSLKGFNINFKELNINEKMRPQEISLENWCKIVKYFS